MPRPAAIWQRKQTGWYYVTLNGQQTKLSKDKKEAERLFHELMAKKPSEEETAEPPTALGISFRKLADVYLVATKDEKVEQAFQGQVTCLKSFCDFLKKRVAAASLQPHMVRSWLRTKPTWGKSTQVMKRKTIKAVLNWGVREGHLKENPLKSMVGGNAERRDRVMQPTEVERIYAFVSADFRDFLRAVELTGAAVQ